MYSQGNRIEGNALFRPIERPCAEAAKARLLALSGALAPEVRSLRAAVRHVVIIASASRGGSSLLHEMLQRADGLSFLQGECNPAFAISGLTYPATGCDSEQLGAEHLGVRHRASTRLAVELLDELLASEAGASANRLGTEEELERFARVLCWRLSAQWPCLEFDQRQVRVWMLDALAELECRGGWQRGSFPDAQAFHLRFLARVRRHAPTVNPYYYDLPELAVRRAFPEVEVPSGPPSEVFIEEPPFILAVPWRPLSEAEAAVKPLVLKAPSNAHRLEFLRSFFSRARLTIVHLTRNAAASINGLIDGWLHHGFFSVRIPGGLRISGYSNSFERWGRDWWKFDLPPTWRLYSDRPLPEVCAEQWRAAHRAILDFVRARSPGYVRIRFEDIVASETSRRAVFEQIAEYLGVPLCPGLARVVRQLPAPVMATRAPSLGRWRAREGLIAPLVADPTTAELMTSLGYDTTQHHWI
jgi:hypothetical protein